MKKNNKKRNNKKILSAVLITLVAVGGLSAIAMISNAETGWINDLARNDEKTSGLYSYSLVSGITATTSDEAEFDQEIEISDTNSPFEKLEVKYTSYADEDNEASVSVGTSVTCEYVEEVTLTFTLAEDVEYNIGTIALNGFGLADTDDEEALDIEVRVDGARFTCVDYSENMLFLSEINPECGEVEIVIKNPHAKDKKVEAHAFTLGTIVFNPLDVSSYAPESA